MPEARKPGRPRDASVEQRVLDAAIKLLQEDGLGGLSIEGIAAEAGVSKATIYRRWDSKEALLVDSVARVVEAVRIEDTGDVRADLITAIEGMRDFVSDTRAGEVFPWLVGEIAAGSEIGARYSNAVIIPRREMLAGLLSGAVQRGELRVDLDIATAVDMLLGPVIVRRIAGVLDKAPSEWPEAIVDTLLSSAYVDL